MSSVKKSQAAVQESPDTQVARSQQRTRNATAEKQVHRSVTPAVGGGTPAPSQTGGAKRPPTGGRRRGKRNREVEVVEVVEEEKPVDPFHGAIQHVANEEGETSGAVMLVTKDNDSDEFGTDFGVDGVDGVTISDVSNWNPHYLQAILVSAIAIFFIAAFGVYVSSFSEPLREVRSEIEDVTWKVDAVYNILTMEYQSAAALMATTEYFLARNQGSTSSYQEQTSSAIDAYRTAIRHTNEQVVSASLVFEKFESKLAEPLGYLRLDRVINLASLDHARDAVLKGAPAAAVFSRYDALFRNLVMFEGRMLAVRAVQDPSDRTTLSRIASLREEQNYGVAAIFSQWVNLTSSATTELRALNSIDELSVPWAIASVVDLDEALRMATSWESYPTSDVDPLIRDYETQPNALILPESTKSLFRQLGEASYVGQGVFWDPVYASTLLKTFVPSSINAFASSYQNGLRDVLSRMVPARRTAQFTCLVLLFCLAVLALVCHIINSVLYYRSRDEHDAANREVRLLQKSLVRMTNFVTKASRLDIHAVGSIIRRAQRAKTLVPPEEQQMYSALSALRDVELFMPATVTHPPLEISKLALNKAQLFLQPALGFTKATVALRINLSVFHSQFFTAGVKQKALQHQMTRCLTALQELTDEHVTHNGSILNVQGDHAIMWINLLRPANYPNMCAISIALALAEECERLSIRTPAMCIASGDALAGHISSVSPNAPDLLASSAMCFTAFGTVTKDFTILETVAKVHDCPLVLNNVAALAYFQERVEFDGEVFHGNTTSLVSIMPSNDGDLNQHSGEVDREDAGKSMNRVAGALPPRERVTLEERLRRLHCYFRPLEMVNSSTSRSTEESLAFVEQNFRTTRDRQQNIRKQRNVHPLGVEPTDPSVDQAPDAIVLDDGATFRDYSRDLPDNSVIFPCFALIPFKPNKQEEDAGMVAAWDNFFASFVESCHSATSDRVSHSLSALTEFSNKYPHAAAATVERLRKLLLLSKKTGEVSTAVGSLKRARLLETLCA